MHSSVLLYAHLPKNKYCVISNESQEHYGCIVLRNSVENQTNNCVYLMHIGSEHAGSC